MFKNVLAATDAVIVQDAPVLAAVQIAAQHGAKLHIIHVLESASIKNRDTVRHYRSGAETLSGAAYRSEVKNEIANRYARQLPEDEHYAIEITTGFPWIEIARYARRIDAALIVVGPHSQKAQEKEVVRVVGKVNSTVAGVIQSAHCPVMIVNSISAAATFAFRRILVGVDFSPSCACALAFAAKLPSTDDGKLFVLHMLPVPPQADYTQDDYADDVRAAARRLQSFSQASIGDRDPEYGVWGGAHPHLEILKWAEAKAVDTIVMGSHTKADQGKWYPGSAVERVSFRSRCPVMVITDPTALKAWDDARPE